MNLAITTALIMAIWSIADTAGQSWAALSGTTTNEGNTFSAGTVALGDNDGGSAPMFTFTNQRPEAVDTSCIHVGYTGSLPSTVKLYASVTGDLAPYLQLTVTRGTEEEPAFDACSDFQPDRIDYEGRGNGVLFSGPLSSFPTTYDAAVADPAASWTSGMGVSYRFSVELADDGDAQGLGSAATFTWEARS